MVSHNTVKRIAKDIKSIINDPIDNIHYLHDESNILKGYLLIIGNSDTPYCYGYNFFTIDFPDNYPFMPPVINYLSNDGYTRFNPNLYISGKVCLSIINTWHGEGWSSCQTLRSIIVILSSIFNASPLLNEPGIEQTNKSVNKYNLLIEYKTITFLIATIVKNINKDLKENSNQFNTTFYMFKDIVNSTFIKNYDSIVINLKNFNKKCKDNNIDNIVIDIYKIKISFDFTTIYNDLESLNKLIKLI